MFMTSNLDSDFCVLFLHENTNENTLMDNTFSEGSIRVFFFEIHGAVGSPLLKTYAMREFWGRFVLSGTDFIVHFFLVWFWECERYKNTRNTQGIDNDDVYSLLCAFLRKNRARDIVGCAIFCGQCRGMWKRILTTRIGKALSQD